MIENQLIGINTAELMETLETSYADDDTAEVVEVLSIAVVRTRRKPDTAEWEDREGESFSFIHYRASEPSWHRQLGLIEAAKWAIADR